MTDPEMEGLQRALGIQLPATYRQALLRFPVPAYVGNTDTLLWDDAAKLIDLNQRLRAGERGPWPAHVFALGQREGELMALDLSAPGERLLWVDRVLDGTGTYALEEGVTDWVASYAKDLRHDLDADGFNPEGPPAERVKLEEQNARSSTRQFLGCLGAVALAMVVGALTCGRWS